MRIIAHFFRMKNLLDDDYTLYENGDVLREYDANNYPRNQNLKTTVNAKELKDDVKQKLYENTSANDKELAKDLLGL